MARIRTIKPEFWEDEIVGTLSRDARLMFIATWNLADDEGLLRWSAEYLKANVFMYDEDISTERVTQLMRELEEEQLVFVYTAGKIHIRVAFITSFRKHQRINKPQPGKLPPPSLQNRDVKLMYAKRDNFQCHLCGELVNEALEAAPSYDDLAEIGNVHFRNASPDHVVPRAFGGSDYPSNIRTAHVSCNKARRDKPVPYSVNDSVNDSGNDEPTEGKGEEGKRKGEGVPAPLSYSPSPDILAWARTQRPDINVEHELAQFQDYHQAKGSDLKDWDAAFRRWIRQARKPFKAPESGGAKHHVIKPLTDEEIARLTGQEPAA